VLPSGWAVYTVQPGNTLFSIARAVGSTVNELSAANCLTNADLIITGDQLFVPELPEEPVVTGVPVQGRPSGESSSLVVGCSDPNVKILAPRPGDRVEGMIPILGSASLSNFWYYRIEVRPDPATIYNFYARYEQPVVDGFLSMVDSTIFDEGLHWIRVSVIDRTGGIPETAVCSVAVIFD